MLQGIDAAGKDGTVKHVAARDVNPSGVRVHSFKEPTSEELAHDFLWRYHQATPADGMIGVFNRSHYEDVLVVRVKDLAPEELWRSRFDSINDFERMLVREGTTIVKCFLHISKEEQLEKFRERLERPDKYWKWSDNDVKERVPLGRLPAGLRGGRQRDEHPVGALVRRAGRPPLVPQLRRRAGARGHAGRDGPAVPEPPADVKRYAEGELTARAEAEGQARAGTAAARPARASSSPAQALDQPRAGQPGAERGERPQRRRSAPCRARGRATAGRARGRRSPAPRRRARGCTRSRPR